MTENTLVRQLSWWRQATGGSTVALFLGLATAGLFAQPVAGNAPARDAETLPSTGDKTGTNPLNIQPAVAVLNDFRSLTDTLFVNRSLYRYVTPLAERRMSAGIELPLVVSNVTGRSEVAFGDLAVRWNWIPWNTQSRGFLVGLDTTWNTSTNDALGTGRPTLAPFVQIVLFPSRAAIVAASYGQRVSTGGDADRPNISIGTTSFYLAWLASPAMWVTAEPEILVDYELDETSGRVDVEWGRLLFGGVGTYVRPGVGLGRQYTKPFDWKLEVGFRVIP